MSIVQASPNNTDKNAQVTAFFEKATSTAQYVVACPETKKCAVIDSVLDYDMSGASTSTTTADEIIKFIKDNGYTVEWILETHAHADHISAAPYIQKILNSGKTGIGENITMVQRVFRNIFHLGEDFKIDGSQFNHLFKDQEEFKIGNLKVKVLHTPGHTPACISYYIENDSVFVGDTIFMPDQGTARCDFPMGSSEEIWNSIHKILSLPETTRIFTCHDYQPGGREAKWESTVAEEKKNNIHVKEGTAKEQFVKWRSERDATLNPPKLIIPSIQVNIRAGFFPKEENDGNVYLKTPVNVLKKNDVTGVYPGDQQLANPIPVQCSQ